MINKENETKKENKKESEKGCVPVNHWVDWSKKKIRNRWNLETTSKNEILVHVHQRREKNNGKVK